MRLCLLLVLFLSLVSARSAGTVSPPPAQLLPTDTLALVSVPDWDKAVSYWKDCPQGKLWRDVALKPVRDKVLEKWRTDFAAPLERQLGIKLADYADLLHGQVTLALTQSGWGADPAAQMGLVLLIDTKDKQHILKARLNDLKKHWVDSGKQLKTEKIRDVEFTSLVCTTDELSKILARAIPGSKPDPDEDVIEPEPETAARKTPTELTFGQSGPLLIVASNSKAIEKIVARQQGGMLPALADQAAYQVNHLSLFRDALVFAWLNVAPVLETFQKQWGHPAPPVKGANPFTPQTDRLLTALGLGAVRTVAARITGGPEGTSADLFVALPEQQRRGVFNLLTSDHKDSAPPGFVGAEVVNFSRWRVQGQKIWATAENVLTSLSPEVAGLIQMGLEAAGKDRDPNFDLRKALTSSLGDDFIVITKNSRSPNAPNPSSPASLYLVGSPNPEQFVQALKAGSGLMPLAGGEPNLQEREFLGHKIYSLGLAAGAEMGSDKGAGGPSTLNFAAGGGYAAISGDPLLVEEYIRGSDSASKPLRDIPGLREAAQRVGGMTTLYFAYQNQAETARAWLEGSKRESAAIEKLLSLTPLAGGKSAAGEPKESASRWLDPSLLPPFEKVSRYFYFLLYSLSASNDGFTWRFFAPVPPQLK